MTDFAPPARSGMPLWARWTLIGCGGCLLITLLGFAGCSALFYQLIGKSIKRIDVADKPDPPPTATAGQLFPLHVDSFVRQKLGHPASPNGESSSARRWEASYLSGSKRVEVIVQPGAGSPFGPSFSQRGSASFGFHFSRKMGAQTLDIITWSKPNWTFAIQSPDQASEAFFHAYRPGVHPASGVRR